MTKNKTSAKAVCALAVLGMGAGSALGVVAGQMDDFQDGTVQGWTNAIGGGGFVNNVDGGQGGVGDRYLEITTSGQAFGPGSRLASFNNSQWTGDYDAAGVTGIKFDMARLSGADVEMRILVSDINGSFFSSNTPATIVTGSGWATYQFDFADLVYVGGPGPTLNTASISQVLLRHQPGVPGGPGGAPAVDGVLGVDNIMAVPAPTGLALLGLAAGLAGRRRRR